MQPQPFAVLAIGAALLLSANRPASAGGPPYGVPSGVMPWEYPRYHGYREPPRAGRPPPPAGPAAQGPAKYTLRVTVLPYQHTYDDRDVALIIAHVPEAARIWFEGEPTERTGTLRYFASPPLRPGRKYTYAVQVQWHEDGRWVSQLHRFPVRAGGVHCLDLIPSRSSDLEKEVAAGLAKLAPEDRAAAKRQRFCAVQEGVRLGAMGVPVKVTLKGRAVFLCCKGCEDKARSSPDQTLEKAGKAEAATKGAAP